MLSSIKIYDHNPVRVTPNGCSSAILVSRVKRIISSKDEQAAHNGWDMVRFHDDPPPPLHKGVKRVERVQTFN